MILYFDYRNPALRLFHPNYAWGQPVSLSMMLLHLEGYYFSRKLHTSKEAPVLLLGPKCFWRTPVLFSDLRIDSDFGINYRLIKNFSQWIGNLPCSVCSAAWCVLLSFILTIMAHPKWAFPGSVKATTTWINPWVSFIYMISFYLWLDGTEMLKCNGHKSI